MEPADFQKITQDLREAGYTDALLARLCGCSRQYIGKIRRGKVGSVSHYIGSKLTALHGAL